MHKAEEIKMQAVKKNCLRDRYSELLVCITLKTGI